MKRRPTCQACREKIEIGRPITVMDGQDFHRHCYRAMKGGAVFIRGMSAPAPQTQKFIPVGILCVPVNES